MKRAYVSLAVLVAAVTIGRSAVAGPIVSIVLSNPSFESFDIGSDGGFTDHLVSGWVMPLLDGFSTGLQNPTDAQYPGTTGLTAAIPGGTGDQFAYAQNTGIIYQDVSAGLNPGLNLLVSGVYTLTVAVGDRIDFAIGPYYLELFAGATLLASTTGSTESLPDGVFTDVSLSYFATTSDPNLGQQLRVQLRADSVLTGAPSQVNYDNVRLLVEVPEPSMAAMICGAGVLTCGRRRRTIQYA